MRCRLIKYIKITRYFLQWFCCVLPFAVFAQVNISLVPVEKNIPALDKKLSVIKKKIAVPVLFPSVIMQDNRFKKYYVYIDLSAEKYGIAYQIYIDSKKNCHGAAYCNIGMMQARKNTKPSIHYNRENRRITKTVNLINNIKGYYTPSHIMADNWPTLISWHYKGVLYTLAWRLPRSNEKKTIIAMANSAIRQKESK